MPNVSFYRQTTGSTVEGAITFDTTNKKIYVGDGSTAHAFEGTDSKNPWVILNSSTGISLSNFFANSTYTKATEIYVKIQACPKNLLFSGGPTSTYATTLYMRLDPTTPGSYISYDNALGHTSYSMSTGVALVYNSRVILDRDSSNYNFQHKYYYFQKQNATATTFLGHTVGSTNCSTATINSYIKILAVRY